MNFNHKLFEGVVLSSKKMNYYFTPIFTTKNTIGSLFNDNVICFNLKTSTFTFVKVSSCEIKAIDILMLKKTLTSYEF